jgi:parvulin-like peptidyl-prolyl isomerase
VSPNAASINGSAFTRTALDQELSDISASPRFLAALQSSGQVEGSGPGTYTQGFVSSILNQRLVFVLIHDDLVRRKALPDAADLSAAAQAAPQQYTDQSGSFFSQFPASYRATLTERLAEAQKLEGLVGTNAADQQYYDTHTAEFATEVCVRHILLAAKDLDGSIDFPASKAEADQEKAKLDDGADFATLAEADSQDNAPGASAANGGALEGSAPDKCLSAQDLSSLVTPFQQAVDELPVDQVSDPVQTQFGYHLIEVTSRTVAPFDQAQATATGDVFRAYLQKELTASSLKVDPQYGSVQKPNADNGNVPTIIPPTGPVFAGSTTTTVAPDATASQ